MEATARRRTGALLSAFFLGLYLLTGGGHGYSADGQFAFAMGKSLWLQPDRADFRDQRRGLSHWGFATPLLLGPWLLLGEAAAMIAPQQDHLIVDGHSFLLEQWPVVGRSTLEGPPPPTTYDVPFRTSPGFAVSALELVSFLALADQIPQSAQVAQLTLEGADGQALVLPLYAGVHTAEWAHDRADVKPRARHQRARVAGRWVGDPVGLHYFARLRLPSPLSVARLTVDYSADVGQLHLRSLHVIGQSASGAVRVPVETGLRFWSPRENRDYFLRLLTSPFNAFVTAATVWLVFAVLGLLGYPRLVGVTIAGLYGMATLAWPYARFDFAEPLVGLSLLAGAYAVLRRQAGGGPLWLPSAGLAVLVAIAAKYASVIALPALAVHVLAGGSGAARSAPHTVLNADQMGASNPLERERGKADERARRGLLTPALRDFAAFAAPFLVLGFPALVIGVRQAGVEPPVLLDTLGGLQRGWLDLPPQIGLRGLLLSPGKSWFLYAPPLILAVMATAAFVRRHRGRAAIFYLVPLAYLLVYGMKGIWYGGSTWGPRYLVPATPFLLITAAPLVAAAWCGRRWARSLVVASLVLGVAVQGAGVGKDFNKYIDLFRLQVAPHLPEDGAVYGGSEYVPWARDQAEGNLTATLFAPPFSPILGHGWLLGADLVRLALPQHTDLLQKALATPPWRFWGIYVQPARPDYGLDFDFWSMRLYLHYASHASVVRAMWLVLFGLEAGLLWVVWRLVGSLTELAVQLRRRLQWVAAGLLAGTLLLFDVLHLLL